MVESAREETSAGAPTAGKQLQGVSVVVCFDKTNFGGDVTHGDRGVDGRSEVVGASSPGFVTFLPHFGVPARLGLGQIPVAWRHLVTTSAWLSFSFSKPA